MTCPFSKDTYDFPTMKKSKECLGVRNEHIFNQYCQTNYIDCRVYKIRMEALEQEQRRLEGRLFSDDYESMEQFEDSDNFF